MFTLKRVNKRRKLLNVTFFNITILSLACFSVSAKNSGTVGDGHSDISHKVVLSFEQAIKAAQKNDPWLTGNRHKQQSIESMSKAASELPDPKVSLGLANLPLDGFDFNQEGMTQLKVGITQMFPRGDTLAIKNRQLRIKSEAYPYQRQDRQAKVAVTVGGLWLDAFRIQQCIELIQKNYFLFEQLVDVAQASYSAALGTTRQQDIIRSQLELTRLEDRLDTLAQQKNHFEGQLFQWVSDFMTYEGEGEGISKGVSVDEGIGAIDSSLTGLHDFNFGTQIPQIELFNAELIYAQKWIKPAQLVKYFSKHPSVMALDKKIRATKTGINLAKQKYQPQWAVNASYGYRADDLTGKSRADLFSVGVTFDLPLFPENRQDQEVKSAISAAEAVKTDKILLLRKMLSAYLSAKGRLLRINERKALYKHKLLPQIIDQAEASLTAYNNDDGDFSEVVRSRIAVLNTEIDELAIEVELQKIILELNYLFIGSSASSVEKVSSKAMMQTISQNIMAKTEIKRK